jgi:hypothetical protein
MKPSKGYEEAAESRRAVGTERRPWLQRPPACKREFQKNICAMVSSTIMGYILYIYICIHGIYMIYIYMVFIYIYGIYIYTHIYGIYIYLYWDGYKPNKHNPTIWCVWYGHPSHAYRNHMFWPFVDRFSGETLGFPHLFLFLKTYGINKNRMVQARMARLNLWSYWFRISGVPPRSVKENHVPHDSAKKVGANLPFWVGDSYGTLW